LLGLATPKITRSNVKSKTRRPGGKGNSRRTDGTTPTGNACRQNVETPYRGGPPGLNGGGKKRGEIAGTSAKIRKKKQRVGQDHLSDRTT